MIKKSTFILFIILLFHATITKAQDPGFYFSGGISTGANMFQYKLDNGNHSTPRLGFGANVGIQYFFHKNWGVATGVGLSFYNSKVQYHNSWNNDPEHYEFEHMIDDDFRNLPNGYEEYTLRLSLSDWTEIQKGYFLEIPLMFMYQTKWGPTKKYGLYAGLGPKLQLPVFKQTYQVKEGSELFVAGHYDNGIDRAIDFPLPGTESMGKHGFGENNQITFSGPMNVKMGIAAGAEVGFLMSLSRRVDLTIGTYFDYGLMNIKDGNKTESGHLIRPENGTNTIHPSSYVGDHLEYNGLANSYTTDQVHLLASGVKIGIRVKLGTMDKKTIIPEPSIIPSTSTEDANEKPIDTILPEESIADTLIHPVKDSTQGIVKDTIPKIVKDSTPDMVIEIIQPADSSHIDLTDEELALLLEPVYFDFDKDMLTVKAVSNLHIKVKILKEYPDLKLLIIGNTCNMGNYDYNYKLGQRRSNSVKNFLIKQGIEKDRLHTESHSFSDPMVPNTTKFNREKNRRCDFELIK